MKPTTQVKIRKDGLDPLRFIQNHRSEIGNSKGFSPVRKIANIQKKEIKLLRSFFMKNFKKLLIISSFCMTSLACAQNYRYNSYPQYSYEVNPNYQAQGYYQPSQSYNPYSSYNQQGQYPSYNQPAQYPSYNQQGQYPNTQQGQYQTNYNGADQRSNKENPEKSNESSWSNWFGSSDKTPNVPDEAITTRVIQNIRSTPYFSNAAKNIQVVTKDGKVTLKGKVTNSNEKNQIEYMIKNVEGVKSVSNDLESIQ
jgi:osmotically-inducible protein OsmY